MKTPDQLAREMIVSVHRKDTLAAAVAPATMATQEEIAEFEKDLDELLFGDPEANDEPVGIIHTPCRSAMSADALKAIECALKS